MKRSDIFKFLILRTVGNFLVLFAIFGFFATFGPALYYEFGFRVAQARGITYTISNDQLVISNNENTNPNQEESIDQNLGLTPTPIVQNQASFPSTGVDNFAQVLAGPKEQVLIPKDNLFSIVIPKIGASAKVFPNIDPASEESFLPILKQGVAHSRGTVFPGQKGNIYLFAHSTDNFWDVGRYNAVFYLLKDLKKGDEVVIFFQNKRYEYVVNDSKVVGANDVSHILDAQKQNKEQLVLQTCWPPGTTLQRLLVFATPK